MLFSKKDYEYILSSLTKKFSLYDFITQEYLINMLDSLMDSGTFEDLTILYDDAKNDVNPLFYINFKIQNYLYYKICKLCEEDIEVLLSLVEDKRRVINLIFRKMKVEDDSKLDDYVMSIASLYNGMESFDSFITRYIMAQIKGVPFTMEKSASASTTSDKLEEVPKDKKKKKKKKTTEKMKIIVVEKVVPSTSSLPDADLKVLEPVILEEQNDLIPDNVQILQVSLYQKCLEKCEYIKGSLNKDGFIEMVLMSDLVNTISLLNDEAYKIYFLMRFGLMNSSFYSKEEIASIMECNILDIIEYEKKVIVDVRNYYNRALSSYESYILTK